jgi:hypothetical protein
MNTKLTIKVVATPPSLDHKEIVASEIKLESFAPWVLDTQLEELLSTALANLRAKGFSDPQACQLEVSVQLTSDEPGMRPALHLSKFVIDQLSAIGASLDFDPYCSP